jgi:GAF domain-containing protein
MKSIPKPANEDQRLAALHRYRLLDTAAETAFDDFTKIASHVCHTPIATISLIDAERQWLKSRIGLEGTEAPREHAFCSYTILGTETLVVEDATADARFADNPLVTGAPHIRFYAGAPLIDRDGHALGALCVVDRKPRPLSAEQQEALAALSRRVMAQIELRQVSSELAVALDELKTLRGLLPICAYCKDIRNDAGYWEKLESYLHTQTGADFSHGICPACLEQHFPAVAARQKARATAG